MAKGGSREQTEADLLREISHKIDCLTGVMAIQGKDAQTQVVPLLDKKPDAIRQLR